MNIQRCTVATVMTILLVSGCTTVKEAPSDAPVPKVIKISPAVKKVAPRKQPQPEVTVQDSAAKGENPEASINRAGRYVPIPAVE